MTIKGKEHAQYWIELAILTFDTASDRITSNEITRDEFDFCKALIFASIEYLERKRNRNEFNALPSNPYEIKY